MKSVAKFLFISLVISNSTNAMQYRRSKKNCMIRVKTLLLLGIIALSNFVGAETLENNNHLIVHNPVCPINEFNGYGFSDVSKASFDYNVVEDSNEQSTKVDTVVKSSLFKKYEVLQENLPYIKFCDLPTPITKLENLGKHISCKNLFMKADYLTGKSQVDGSHLYGGNKPRKLEYLLADARSKGKETIVTYGCAGSQHALATAVYAKEMGFKKCILMLKDQPNSPIVRHNLLLDQYVGAELRFFPNNQVRSLAAEEVLKNDHESYLIPTGGSNEIGTIGFVNAAFELAEQVNNGLINQPDFIYIPIGSCATTAGLLLGIQAAGLKSKVVAVAVEPEEIEDEFYLRTKELFEKSNKYLNSLDESFKIESFPSDKLIINKKFAGTQYGLVTKEASEAMRLAHKIEGIKLEGTYSSKPIAAIMDDIASGTIKDQTILFWNTFCGIDYSYLTKYIDYKKLPIEFHKYFEEEVQPLSKME